MTTTKYKAMKHQAVSLKFMSKREIMLDFSDPGTGKTFVQIMAYYPRWKKQGKKRKCMLVVAPKSLLEPAWADDIAKFAPELVVSVAHAANRAEAFAVEADVYITNTDAAVWLAKQPKSFFAKFDTLVIDELPAFKHPTSQRSKAMSKIKKHFKYRSGLSGTPNSNTITDVWHQVNLIDDGKRLGNQFYAFRNAVCTPKQVGASKNAVRWEDKIGAEDVVYGMISDITIRHKSDDCLDLPDNNQYTMQYKLTNKQLKVYKEMAMTQMAAIEKLKIVTAINAAAVITKLLQISSGAVYEHTGKYHLVDTGRYELVLDLVEERKHSIVFYLWQHQRDYLAAEAKKRGIRFCVYDSNASDKVRREMVRDFQAGMYQMFLGHPASMAHGLTLTKASTTIWPSPTANAEHFVQGNKRHHRNGQTQKTETIVILAPGTHEENVYASYLKKNARMTNLLDLFS